jgi:integrase
MRVHVLPAFGEAQLGNISPLEVQAWVNELALSDLSSSTVHGCYRLLSRVMAAAVRSELIAHSPCREIKLPRQHHIEMKFLSADQLKQLADASGSFRPVVLTAGYLGLRWGEIAGLRRKRYNALKGTVEIVEILTEVAGRLDFGPPKTKASRRQVSLPAFLADIFEAVLAERPAGSDELIFVGRDSGPLRRTNFRKRHWIPALGKAGLPTDIRFHDLRHTCAALLIAQGAHPKEIQARLGHSSITTTLDRYGHLFPSLDDRLRVGLDDLYRASQSE